LFLQIWDTCVGRPGALEDGSAAKVELLADCGWVDFRDGESDARLGLAGLGVELDGTVVVADEVTRPVLAN
jgi:hypothetical protein